MLENFATVWANVGVALAAMFVVTLFKQRRAINANEFVASVFWKENKGLWIWTISIIAIVAHVNQFAPESLGVIMDYAGLKLTEGPGAFAVLALVLMTTQKTTKTLAKKKAQIKNREAVINS